MIRIVLASFELEKKLGKSTFFHKTFLLADISVEVVLMMFFLTFSNVELLFSEQELSWRFYTTAGTLSTTKWVELINEKKFARAAIDENIKAFVIYMTFLSLSLMLIHPDGRLK